MKVLIIGGVACGAKTASRLARLSQDVEVTILERGNDLSYSNCGFPFFLGNEVKDSKSLTHTAFGVYRGEDYFKDYTDTKALTGHEAINIDRENKTVKVKVAATGEMKDFPYDKLVIATGASPIRPKIPGMDLGNVFTLWTLSDALKVHDAMAKSKDSPVSVAVVGAGLVGVEAAEAFSKKGANVFLLDALSRPLFCIAGEEFGALAQKEIEKHGVTFYGEERMIELEGSEFVSAVKTDKRVIKADIVLVSIGVRPNLALAQDCGLKIGKAGIVVNSRMQTSDPDIYAGGDCVESTDMVTGASVWQPMGSAANKQGRVIADNIAGIDSHFNGVSGTAIVRVFDAVLGKTGLTLEGARAFGFDAIGITASNPDIPPFMPKVGMTTIRLIADKKTQRILGMQAIGNGVIDKRIDVAAAVIMGKLTLSDVADMDLAYAPPFSTALDTLAHAANALRNKISGILASSSALDIKTRLDKGENILFLELRTQNEIKAFGIIKGENLNIPLGELRARLDEVPKDRPLVLDCKIGARSWTAYTILSQAGFTNMEVLEGGFVAWPYEKTKIEF